MTTVGGVGEAGLIELIKPYISKRAGGDDAVTMDPSSDYEVVSTDMSVEGVHFDLSWMRAEDAGWRALAFALGDLAAKGAAPMWALASVAIPRHWETRDFVGLFKGMSKLGARNFFYVEGGDLSATDGPAVIALTVGGACDSKPIPRSAVKPGWAVAVTGPLGKSAVALREHRVLTPEPLIEEGMRLNELGLCCGDISDGLVREMEKFAQMAGVGYRLDARKVPVAAGATLADALTSGEEVQLVCVGPEKRIRKAGLEPVGELTESGSIIEGVDESPRGYDHFA